MQTKTKMRYHITTETSTHQKKKKKPTNAGVNAETKGLSFSAGGNEILTCPVFLENSMYIHQINRNWSPIWTGNTTPGNIT